MLLTNNLFYKNLKQFFFSHKFFQYFSYYYYYYYYYYEVIKFSPINYNALSIFSYELPILLPDHIKLLFSSQNPLPSVTHVVGLNYLFIQKKNIYNFIFIRSLVFLYFKKLFFFLQNYFIILFVKRIGVL
jgi:hypothetical protein